MKRINGLYEQIISIENLELADSKARKGKKNKKEIANFDQDRSNLLLKLHEQLKSLAYKTSEYHVFKIYEPKERIVYRLPYYPDRIAHHALMNVLEPIFVQCFTTNTYSCIKERGIHKGLQDIKSALHDVQATQYCLKLDITKFYPSVDHDVLKSLLRKKFKDVRLLILLDEIIDSCPGLPIGNYLSQFLANFYLTGFDHWIKEQKKVEYYFRYADDIVIFAPEKPYLHKLLSEIREYFEVKLKLKIKPNYQVFSVDIRGVDVLGYKFYHTYIRLRKSIKQNFARKLKRNPSRQSIASYSGWLTHCNAKHLTKKLLHDHC